MGYNGINGVVMGGRGRIGGLNITENIFIKLPKGEVRLPMDRSYIII